MMNNKKRQPSNYEQMKEMLNNVRKLTEQTDPRYNQNPQGAQPAPDASQQPAQQTNALTIGGEKIAVDASNKANNEITDAEKNTFQQTVQEFRKQVSELVDFNTLLIKENSIEWSGKLIKADVDFFYLIGEKNGVFLKGEMIKVDQDFTTLVNQLNQYYKAFTNSWTPILNDRKAMSADENDQHNEVN